MPRSARTNRTARRTAKRYGVYRRPWLGYVRNPQPPTTKFTPTISPTPITQPVNFGTGPQLSEGYYCGPDAHYFIEVDWDNDGNYGDPYDDVSDDLLQRVSIKMVYGRDDARALLPLAAGRLTFELCDTEGLYDENNAASPLVGDIVPGRTARLRARDVATGLDIILFSGFIDDIQNTWNRVYSTVPVSVADGLAAKLQGVEVSTAVYQGIKTGEAIELILDAADWPALDRQVDPGSTTIPWFHVENMSAFEAVRRLVASEGPPALAFIDPTTGDFVFQDRHHRLLRTRSQVSQATFCVNYPGCGNTVFIENFDTEDTSVWNGYSSPGISVANNELSLIPTTSYFGIDTIGSFPFEDRAFTVELVQIPNLGNGTSQSYAIAQASPGNNVRFESEAFGSDQRLIAKRSVGGATTYMTDLAYSPINHRWLRIREDDGVVYWETSPDGAVWNAFDSWTSTFPLTTVELVFGSGFYGVEPDPGTAKWAHVSIGSTPCPGDSFPYAEPFDYRNTRQNIINHAKFQIDNYIIATEFTDIWKTDQILNLEDESIDIFVTSQGDPFVEAFVAPTTQGTGTLVTSLSRDSGKSTIMTLTATGFKSILTLALRGRVMSVENTVQVEAEDALSIAEFSRSTYAPDAPWVGVHDARAIADGVVARWGRRNPIVRVRVLNRDRHPEQLDKIMDLGVGDRVTIVNQLVNLSDDFIIERVEREITGRGKLHAVTFTCERAFEIDNPDTVFRFDTAGQGFNDGLFGN